jgi:hypothetical protein
LVTFRPLREIYAGCALLLLVVALFALRQAHAEERRADSI